ncbi:MAG: cell division protein FtsL [Holosporaceae bacterium]|jgi:cell division protein FtsL|nr:cell division protein FtsL [Holosporaceae bacterium]
MITKKSSIFFAILICVVGAWLFYLKYSVLSIENRIRQTKKEIAIEKKNHHILKAEWKTLISPERIQRLAVKHLKMRQIEPKQLREFDASIFHSEKSKYKETKRLSKLVDEIFSLESRR